MREAFAAALFLLDLDPNTTNDADLDAALQLLQEQKPLVRIYTTDDISVLSSGDAWVAHAWGSDVCQVNKERPTVKFYIPEEGGVRGSDTLGPPGQRQAPRRGAAVHEPPARREGEREEHELHRLHGPQRCREGVHQAVHPRRTRR